MTSTFTIVAQVIASILQVLNAINVAQLPVKWQLGFTTLLTILQAVQGAVAHYYTPSGVSLAHPATTVTTTAAGTQPANKPPDAA
jgi:hypothetical protein